MGRIQSISTEGVGWRVFAYMPSPRFVAGCVLYFSLCVCVFFFILGRGGWGGGPVGQSWRQVVFASSRVECVICSEIGKCS